MMGECCSAALGDRRWWIRALSGPMSAWGTSMMGEGGKAEGLPNPRISNMLTRDYPNWWVSSGAEVSWMARERCSKCIHWWHVRATWLKRTTGYYYRRNCQFPCRQMTFPVCQDIKISQVWNQWLIGMKSFIIFDFSGTRARTADFTGAVNPHAWAAIELLQVLAIAPFPGSGGAMISPPHLLSFVEMRKPDCFVLRVPFEIRHTRPCLS